MNKELLTKIAEAKHIKTATSTLDLFKQCTGLIYADETFMNAENSDWYLPAGQYINDKNNAVTEEELENQIGSDVIEGLNDKFDLDKDNDIDEIDLKLFKSKTDTNLVDGLYISGEATETGTNLNNSRKFKMISEDNYEIFTQLTENNSFVINNIKTINNQKYNIEYYIDNNELKECTDEISESSINTTGVYYITVNMTNMSISIEEVKDVSFWYAWNQNDSENPDNLNINVSLTYSNNGTWTGNKDITLLTQIWGIEKRYKFRMTLNNGSNDYHILWGPISNESNDLTLINYGIFEEREQLFRNWVLRDVTANNINLNVSFIVNDSEYTHNYSIVNK